MSRSPSRILLYCISFANLAVTSPAPYGSIVTASINRTAPYPCNGTGYYPPWTGSSVSDISSCNASATTITITATSTFFASTTTKEVLATDADSINGDDCPPYCGPRTDGSTITYTTHITSSVNQTTTLTTTSTPVNSTTAATPPGFLPIRSTLPTATFLDPYDIRDPALAARKRNIAARAVTPSFCTLKTVTIISSVTITSTATVTHSAGAGGGLVWVFPLENTFLDGATYTYPSPTYLLVTATTTQYAYTSTKTLTANTTTTTTIYAACATDNWADAIVLSDNSTSSIVGGNGDGSYAYFPGEANGIQPTPYDCCALSIELGSEAWFWGGGAGENGTESCFLVGPSSTSSEPYNHTCSPEVSTYEVYYGQLPLYIYYVIGNSYCGTYNAATEDPNASASAAT